MALRASTCSSWRMHESLVAIRSARCATSSSAISLREIAALVAYEMAAGASPLVTAVERKVRRLSMPAGGSKGGAGGNGGAGTDGGDGGDEGGG